MRNTSKYDCFGYTNYDDGYVESGIVDMKKCHSCDKEFEEELINKDNLCPRCLEGCTD